MEIGLFNLQHMSVLKAQPQQRISNIYIYLYVSYQSMYIIQTVGLLHTPDPKSEKNSPVNQLITKKTGFSTLFNVHCNIVIMASLFYYKSKCLY